jgi:hypothetical protein
MKYDLSMLVNPETKVRVCTLDDVDKHYNLVRPLVIGTDENVYKAEMVKAIEQGTAFSVLDRSCFVYYLKDDEYSARGISIYGKGNPLGMTALFLGIFNPTRDINTRKISFYPHTTSVINEYKSLLTVKSIRKWYEFGLPVVVWIKPIRLKADYILNKITKL